MTVRLHYEDMGWDFVERWADAFPDVTVEQAATRTFADSLSDCRVYVCDHVSTTFLEAMAADRPTILFWDPATYPLRAEAQASFDLLRTVGILHDGPDAAADHVALIYGDVDAWWRSAELQRVRADFCDVYARTAQAPVAAWASELRSVLRQTRREPTTRTSPPRSGDER
jgi:putative transferase (TIGR04331 family)